MCVSECIKVRRQNAHVPSGAMRDAYVALRSTSVASPALATTLDFFGRITGTR